MQKSGEECLAPGVKLPLFSVTQERPFHNEIKLAYPCKRTNYPANRLRREGDRLIVGFELVPYDAIVQLTVTEGYVNFSLERFEVDHSKYGYELSMYLPPFAQFRLLHLPVRSRENYGDWLNVCWDNAAAVNVLASDPKTMVGTQHRDHYELMYADLRNDIGIAGNGVAWIVSKPDALLDAIASVEEDFDLPRGVESRRGPHINASIYWVHDLSPNNVDEHIRNAKAAGLRMMLIYYTSMILEGTYNLEGNYDYRPEYPNGKEDLVQMLNKIKASGITPGLHFLQTFIGLQSRYVTPVADHRLNLKWHFTLSKALNATDDVVYVEQSPVGSVMKDMCRLLQFGSELISYEAYTTEWPYFFTGGEPFAQPAFLLEMLRLAKQEGLHVYIETCGFVRREILEQAMEYVDLFLFDYKETDLEKHKTFTGVDPRLIRDNLQFLAENEKKIVRRCPIVPGCNDTQDHLEATGLLAERYDSIIRVDVEPYHPLGKTKAAPLGKEVCVA